MARMTKANYLLLAADLATAFGNRTGGVDTLVQILDDRNTRHVFFDYVATPTAGTLARMTAAVDALNLAQLANPSTGSLSLWG